MHLQYLRVVISGQDREHGRRRTPRDSVLLSGTTATASPPWKPPARSLKQQRLLTTLWKPPACSTGCNSLRSSPSAAVLASSHRVERAGPFQSHPQRAAASSSPADSFGRLRSLSRPSRVAVSPRGLDSARRRNRVAGRGLVFTRAKRAWARKTRSVFRCRADGEGPGCAWSPVATRALRYRPGGM